MKKPAKNGLEWTVFIASTLVVLAVLGYLATTAVTVEKTPPDLRIEAGRPLGHRVPLVVRNAGGTTAESVVIEAVLVRGGEEVESAQLELMFVPRRSEREGWVVFRHDPRCCTIVTRAVSYEEP